MTLRYRVGFLTAACLLALGTSVGLASAQKAPTIPYEKFTLPNGLEVILHVDRSVPIVAVENFYKVGSGDEKRAGSSFTMRKEAGPFRANAEVVSAKTDSALIEFMSELKAIRDPLPADELAKAKRYLQLGYTENFESTGDIAAQLAQLIPYGLPLTTLSAFNAGIGSVTVQSAQRAANRYLDPSKMTIVITGDRATIESALKATGIAPVDVRDSRGRPVITP